MDMGKVEKEQGDFCFLANMKTYLEQFGQVYEEFWLGGITGVMGFYFTKKEVGVPSIIHGRSEEFEAMYASFMEYVKEPLTVELYQDTKEAMSRLKELLAEKITPMMWMDEYYLKGAYNYQKNHLWVMAVILDVTEEGLLLFNNEELKAEFDELAPLLNRNGVISISYTKQKKIEFLHSDRTLVYLGMKKTVQNMRKETTIEDEYFGLSGMNVFKEELKSCTDFNKIYEYFFELNRGGGLYKTRRNMKLFLEAVKSRWTLEEVTPCISIYTDLEEQWMKISNLLFKLTVCKDTALQERIVKRVEKAICLEEEGVKEMEQLLLFLSDHINEQMLQNGG